MAATPSTMLALGTSLPDFTLPNAVDGRPVVGRDELRGRKALVVMFLCNHCPYVIHVRPEIERVVAEFAPAGVGFAAINANSLVTHPQDGPEHMKRLAIERGWPFPFLFDETQEVARAFGAACTPDFYAFDAGLRLAYRGRLDESTPGNGKPLTGRDLRDALTAIVAGGRPSDDQLPSIGCNIKWSPANAPSALRRAGRGASLCAGASVIGLPRARSVDAHTAC